MEVGEAGAVVEVEVVVDPTLEAAAVPQVAAVPVVVGETVAKTPSPQANPGVQDTPLGPQIQPVTAIIDMGTKLTFVSNP